MILNRDVSAMTMIILCVAQTIQQSERSEPSWSVELTDGWYSVRASLDLPLSNYVEQGRVKVGSKILVSDAHLVGFEEGVDPLDPTYDALDRQCSPVLRLSANATRLARWDAKLGFVRPTKATRASGGLLRVEKVSDIVPAGGRLPLIDLIVVRKYPVLYREKKGNETTATPGADRNPRTLTESEEAERLISLEKRKHYLAEKVLQEVETECSVVCWTRN
jgi:breast cancer 2 susceptibility protein